MKSELDPVAGHREHEGRAAGWAIRHRARMVAITAGLLLATAGCGDDPSGPAGANDDGGTSAGEPTIQATFDITGVVTVKDTVTSILPAGYSGTKPATCDEYAKGSTTSSGKPVLMLPNFVTEDSIGGQRLTVDGKVSDYHGPGTYPRSQLSGQGGAIAIMTGDHSLSAGDKSNLSVTINPDGSGSFTFDQLMGMSNGTTPESISGKLSWTCKDG